MAEEFTSITTITQACEAFVLSLKESRYYDAHEDLEAIWFPRRFEDDDEVKLWKGFINAAVCFELIRKGRLNASQTAWKTYLKYCPFLETLTGEHCGTYVKIVHLIEEIRSYQCPNS